MLSLGTMNAVLVDLDYLIPEWQWYLPYEKHSSLIFIMFEIWAIRNWHLELLIYVFHFYTFFQIIS